MKTKSHVFPFGLLFALVLLAAAPSSIATDLAVTGNLTVSGTTTLTGTTTLNGDFASHGAFDSYNSALNFGTVGSLSGVSLIYFDHTTDAVTFGVNRSTGTGSWLWETLTPTTLPAMRLTNANQLLLYQADGITPGVTLTPSGNSLTLGSATLSGGTALSTIGAMTVGGAFTAPSYAVTGGSIAGGSAGLALTAGGYNQSITLTPNGTGVIALMGNVGIGTNNPGSYSLYVKGAYSSFTEAAGVNQLVIYPNHGGFNQIYSSYHSGSTSLPLSLGSDPNYLAALNIFNNGRIGIGNTSPNNLLTVGGTNGQSTALISARSGGNDIEFGHANTAGYGSTIGASSGNGMPFIAFASEAGTTTNTFKTRGLVGTVISTTSATTGGLTINSVANANADNQSLTELMRITSTGNVGVGTSSPTALLQVGQSNSGQIFKVGVSGNMANSNAEIRSSLGVLAADASSVSVLGAEAWDFYNAGNSPSWSGTLVQYYGSAYAGNVYGFPAANQGAIVFQNVSNGVIASNGANIAVSPAGAVSATFLANGNVGIGTTSPDSKLTVAGGSNNGIHVTGDGTLFQLNNTDSTSAFALNVWSGNGGVQFYDSTDGGATWSNSINLKDGNVGIGTTSPTQKLSVAGTIRAYEVIVDTGWSDYVFDKDYHLAPLSEVEQQIMSNKHLTGIPSAQEVANHGISLGEMQSKLLAKVEELTLHLIAQEKQLVAQSARIEQLEQQNTARQVR